MASRWSTQLILKFKGRSGYRLGTSGTCSSRLTPILEVTSSERCSRPISTSLTRAEFKIYTRTGDKGTTALFTGERRPKNDAVFDVLGSTDELSSHIAMARAFALESDHPYAERLLRIQCILQDISAVLATPKSSAREAHLKKVGFSERHSSELEEWIDEYTAQLPPLENFILPGGGKASASLHVARTVCRRAERRLAPLVMSGETDTQALIYLNRLSDFLFTAARYAAKLDKRQEEIYIRSEDPDPKRTVTTPCKPKRKPEV